MSFKFWALPVVLLALFSLNSGAVARTEEETGAVLAKALDAGGSGNWGKAAHLANDAAGPIASDIVTWMHLRSGDDDNWTHYTDFLARHGDWPGLKILRIKGERTIPKASDPKRVIKYFMAQRPQTGSGILRLAAALTATDRNKEAKSEAIRAWRTFSLSNDQRREFLTTYAKSLKPYHIERLDMLLWRGKSTQAQKMFSYVPDGYVKLAKARIALRRKARGVDGLIKAVPAKLRDDAGLAYERFLWRSKKGLDNSARDLLIERSNTRARLGRPDMWAKRRRKIARQEMRDGHNRRAYEIAAKNQMTDGSDFADLEWLAGYIALRKLNDPALALVHFNHFRAAVATPISFGRAGYWQGRALEAKGDKAAAISAFAFAAQYQTSFYGQLAAEHIGAKPDAALAGREKSPDWRTAKFADSTLIHAAMALHYADRPRLAELFFRAIGARVDRTGIQQLADLAIELGRPKIALKLSKQAARRGIVLPKSYFPVTELAHADLAVKPEVALSIARRESELDQSAISPAGARGLMQIMPKTARKVARKIGVSYSKSKLTSDWKYNAKLASSYLAGQLSDFNGSYILAFAAYNAGPSRARKWIKKYGDPRRDTADQIDWIEHIPFRETRNYVMRVTESLFVYRARINGRTPKLRISKDLKKG